MEMAVRSDKRRVRRCQEHGQSLMKRVLYETGVYMTFLFWRCYVPYVLVTMRAELGLDEGWMRVWPSRSVRVKYYSRLILLSSLRR